MGTSVASLHVRTADLDTVVDAVGSSDRVARCTGPDHGWVSVYEERASAHDEHGIAALCSSLSGLTGSPTVAFMLHDSDLLRCWVAIDGRVVTHMDSWPDFPDRSPRPIITGPGGFLSLCSPSVTAEVLREVLGREVVFVDDTLVELASYVGISAAAVLGEYHDPHHGETIIDWTALLPEVRDESTPEARQLIDAAASGDVATIAAVLDGGVSTEVVGPWTAPEFASLPGATFPAVQATALFAAAAEGRVAAIEMLLARGADPNRTIPHGDSPVLAAATRGHPDALEVLLRGGATLAQSETAEQAKPVAEVFAQLAQVRQLASMARDLPGIPAVTGLPDATALDACAALLTEAFGEA